MDIDIIESAAQRTERALLLMDALIPSMEYSTGYSLHVSDFASGSFHYAVLSGLLSLPYPVFTGNLEDVKASGERPFGKDLTWEDAPVAYRTSFVRKSFSLTIVELASVLGVERKTIYSWLDEENEPKLQGRHNSRLQALYTFAQEWVKDKLNDSPKLLDVEYEGVSLRQLLREESIDRQRIYELFDKLREAKNVPQRRTSLAEQLDALDSNHLRSPCLLEIATSHVC